MKTYKFNKFYKFYINKITREKFYKCECCSPSKLFKTKAKGPPVCVGSRKRTTHFIFGMDNDDILNCVS